MKSKDAQELACLGVIIVVIYAVLIDPFITMMLWRWFVVKGFGVAPISYPLAAGLAILARHLFPKGAAKSEDSDTSIAVKFCTAFAMPLLLLGCAYVWHLFV